MNGLFLAMGFLVVLLAVFVATMLLLGVFIAFGTRGIGADESEPVVPAPHRPIWRQP